jgi:hypothetical protein
MSNAVIDLLEQLLACARAGEAAKPQEQAPPPPEYLSVDDFAKRLAMRPKAVRQLLKEGMPHVRPRPRTIRIHVAKADAWIEARSKPAGAAEAEARRLALADAHKGTVN